MFYVYDNVRSELNVISVTYRYCIDVADVQNILSIAETVERCVQLVHRRTHALSPPMAQLYSLCA